MRSLYRIVFESVLVSLLGFSLVVASEKNDRTDMVEVSVVPRMTKNPSGSNTYLYTVISSARSLRPVSLFALELGDSLPPITNLHTPKGWTEANCSQTPPKICWFWNGFDEGKLIPGGQLAGFGFDSRLKAKKIKYFTGNNPSKGQINDADAFLNGFVIGETDGPKYDIPSAVVKFIELREQCDHWSGEPPYDKDRSEEINRNIKTLHCDSLDAQKNELLKTYKSNEEVSDVLESQDNR